MLGQSTRAASASRCRGQHRYRGLDYDLALHPFRSARKCTAAAGDRTPAATQPRGLCRPLNCLPAAATGEILINPSCHAMRIRRSSGAEARARHTLDRVRAQRLRPIERWRLTFDAVGNALWSITCGRGWWPASAFALPVPLCHPSGSRPLGAISLAG